MWGTRAVSGPRACTRAGEEEEGRVVRSGPERFTSPLAAPHLDQGAQLACGRGGAGPASLALSGVGVRGRGGGEGAGRVSREPLRLPPL